MASDVHDLVNRYVSRYVNKIEIIGHKKSLYIEIRLYTTGKEQYTELFDSLSKLNLENIADLALLAQNKLSLLGIDSDKLEQVQKQVQENNNAGKTK
jgi:hypothetical protein